MDLENNFKRINDKLQHLLKNHQQLKKDNEKQIHVIKELQEIKEKNTQQIQTLQQQILILKAATSALTECDKVMFEKHINRYIREIDKCIGLLGE